MYTVTLLASSEVYCLGVFLQPQNKISTKQRENMINLFILYHLPKNYNFHDKCSFFIFGFLFVFFLTHCEHNLLFRNIQVENCEEHGYKQFGLCALLHLLQKT